MRNILPKLAIVSLVAFFGGALLISESGAIASKRPAKKKEIRWMIAHSPSRYFLRAANRFKEVVEDKQVGMSVKVISNPELEPELTAAPTDHPDWWGDKVLSRHEQVDLRVLAEELVTGDGEDVNMMQVYTSDLARYSPQFAVLDTPGIFRDYEHVEQVVEGPVGERLLSSMEDQAVKPLAFTFSGGFMSFMSHGKPLTNLGDLEGGSCRLFYNRESSVLKDTCNGLGMKSVTVRNSKGIVPGPFDYIRYNLADFIEVNYEDAGRYLRKDGMVLLNTRHRVLFTALVINRKFYDSLSPEEQKSVKEAAVLAAREERHSFVEAQAKLENSPELKDSIYFLSAEDQKKMEQLSKTTQAKAKAAFGGQLLEEIQATGLN